MVEAGLRVYWEEEARKRGVIVASPVAPNGVLFFRGSEKHVPELLRKFQEEFAVADGEFHLVGISNGGVAAFRVALLYPELFQSMKVLPGIPPTDAGYGYLSRLRDMRIAMYVGELDDGFRPQTERAHGVFKSVGKEIHLEIIPGEGHFVQSLGAYTLSLTGRFAGCRGPVLVAMRSPKSGFSSHGPLCYVRTD